MKRTISTWAEFKKHWGGNVNFLMAGECVPFHFDMPPVEDVIEIIRKDPDARITNSSRRSEGRAGHEQPAAGR